MRGADVFRFEPTRALLISSGSSVRDAYYQVLCEDLGECNEQLHQTWPTLM